MDQKNNAVTLNQYLIVKTVEKSNFSVAELKRRFPKDKKQIDKLKFIGLLEPVSYEFPDTVRAHIHS